MGRRVFAHEYVAALCEPRQAAVHVSSRGHRGALFVLCRLGIRHAYRDYQRDDHAADVPDVDVHLRRDGIVRTQVRAVVRDRRVVVVAAGAVQTVVHRVEYAVYPGLVHVVGAVGAVYLVDLSASRLHQHEHDGIAVLAEAAVVELLGVGALRKPVKAGVSEDNPDIRVYLPGGAVQDIKKLLRLFAAEGVLVILKRAEIAVVLLGGALRAERPGHDEDHSADEHGEHSFDELKQKAYPLTDPAARRAR